MEAPMDPSGGGIGKAAKEMMQEMQRTQQQEMQPVIYVHNQPVDLFLPGRDY